METDWVSGTYGLALVVVNFVASKSNRLLRSLLAPQMFPLANIFKWICLMWDASNIGGVFPYAGARMTTKVRIVTILNIVVSKVNP